MEQFNTFSVYINLSVFVISPIKKESEMILQRFFISHISALKYLSKTTVIKKEKIWET